MTRITALSAALLYGREPVRPTAVFRFGDRAGRFPGRIIEAARNRPARPFSRLSPS
jgi:hypothetical protein